MQHENERAADIRRINEKFIADLESSLTPYQREFYEMLKKHSGESER